MAKTIMDGLSKRLAISEFLSNTFEDNHIRIDGHTYSKHNTRDTRKGKYGVDTH